MHLRLRAKSTTAYHLNERLVNGFRVNWLFKMKERLDGKLSSFTFAPHVVLILDWSVETQVVKLLKVVKL